MIRGRWIIVGVAAPVALGLGACNSGGGSASDGGTSHDSAAAPHHRAAADQPDQSGSPSTSAPQGSKATDSPSGPTNSGTAANGAPLPNIEPSTVISQATGHTQLSSPQGVSSVTAFYEKALNDGGWKVTSAAKTAASANFVANRKGEGTTVSIASAGPSGTSVSISTHPS